MADSRFTLTWDEVHRAESKKIGGQICLKTCPWCRHDDYRIKIHPDTGAYFCHGANCEAKGVVTNGDQDNESWRPNTPEVHAKAPDKPKKFALPDLSRAQGINQRVIDYMATRGISEETCRKLRLGFENHPGLGPSVIFPSFDKAGQKVINVKYRKIASKDFRNSPDTYRPFFGLPTLTNPSAPVIIVEGEIDQATLVECGFDNVLSIPDGSNAKGSQGKKLDCLPSAEKELIAAKRVIIATDGDDAGRAMAQELATRIGMDKVALVEFPDDAKDANDYLMRHGRDALVNLIHAATSPVLDGVSVITDYQEDIWEHRHLFGKDGYAIPGMDKFTEMCRFHPGSLVIVTGVPGAGKSSFLRAAMILLAGSRDYFPVAMFAPEDAPMPRKFFEKFVRLVSGSSVAEMGRANYEMVVDLVKEKILLIHPESNSLDDILLRAEYTVLNHGAKVIVIDPWTEVVTTRERGEGEVEHINKCLSRIQRFARDKGVVVIISAHPTKQGVERSKGNDGVVQLFDISGTASWNNKADFGISIKRSAEHPDSIVSEIHVVKVRDGDYGKLGSVDMSHNPRTGQYKEL